jgi:hypothetical protein
VKPQAGFLLIRKWFKLPKFYLHGDQKLCNLETFRNQSDFFSSKAKQTSRIDSIVIKALIKIKGIPCLLKKINVFPLLFFYASRYFYISFFFFSKIHLIPGYIPLSCYDTFSVWPPAGKFFSFFKLKHIKSIDGWFTLQETVSQDFSSRFLIKQLLLTPVETPSEVFFNYLKKIVELFIFVIDFPVYS